MNSENARFVQVSALLQSTMPPVRIALLQYDPKFGRADDNIEKVDAMFANVTPGSIDILLLPEMAFTGYMMKDINEARCYLEIPSQEEDSPTVIWAKRTSKRLGCYTLVGFPELDSMYCMAWNSLLVVDTNGELQVGARACRSETMANEVSRMSTGSTSYTKQTRRGHLKASLSSLSSSICRTGQSRS